MNRNKIRKLACGVVVASGFFRAKGAHASGWCPTATDYQITCSSCSRELTCDVNNLGIDILGNGVTLDGKNYWINYAPYNAVNVQGYATTIKNLNTYEPYYASIQFNSSSTSGVAYVVDHVHLHAGIGGEYGVFNQSGDEVAISNSDIDNATQAGVLSNTSKPTDFTYSYAAYNLDGWWASLSGNNSMIINSSLLANNNIGIFANNVTGLVISGNTINDNGGVGLSMNNVGGSVKNNHGVRSGSWDCYESHSGTLNISHSGNSWGAYSGAGCP